MEKVGTCQADLSAIEPDTFRFMECQDFVAQGIDFGWLNNMDNFEELFMPTPEQKAAGRETLKRSENLANVARKIQYSSKSDD